MSDSNTIELATELTIAWLSNPSTRASADDVHGFLKVMSDTIEGLSSPTTEGSAGESPSQYTPAVTVRKSLASRDHIISMIDGRPYRSLKRHLTARGLTPDEYRKRYNLKADYPIVSPGYSEARRETTKRIGLGRTSASAPAQEAASTIEEPKRPARKRQTTSAEKATSDVDVPAKSVSKTRTRKPKVEMEGIAQPSD